MVTNSKDVTLAACGASGRAWDDGRIRDTRDLELVVEPGDTDSFVYKATVSAADSDAAGQGTITITYIE